MSHWRDAELAAKAELKAMIEHAASPEQVAFREAEYDRICPQWRNGRNVLIESRETLPDGRVLVSFDSGVSATTADSTVIAEARRLHEKRWPVDFSLTNTAYGMVLLSLNATNAFKAPEFRK